MSVSGRSRDRAKGAARAPRRRATVEVPSEDALRAAALDEAERRALVESLLAWFDRSARDMPWRRTRDPYAIWLSEVMLQQTRVDTVIPYYERFLERWPTVESLASATLDDVLLRWSGLGYYRRARMLHLAAREVVERYGGAFPRTATELRALSGVGAYTAGAVASIAFDESTPLVDGNVIRVLSRIAGLDDDMRQKRGTDAIWALAASLVPQARAGAFNQSLMELGSEVCTPRAPSCASCPVSAHCRAYAEGRTDELPRLAPKKAPRAEQHVALVVRSGERVFLVRRRPEGLFAGLWEPPLFAELAAAARASKALGVVRDAAVVRLGAVRHVLSHRRLAIEVHGAELEERASKAASPKGTFERLEQTEETLGATYDELAFTQPAKVALSTLAKKLLAVAGMTAALVFAPTNARAQGKGQASTDSDPAIAADDASGLEPAELATYRELVAQSSRYARVLTTVGGGRGVRFNNPFRLRTQLGATAESLSLTAPYFDVGVGVALGDPFKTQHGVMSHLSVATEGVSQASISASYMVLRRGSSAWLGYGRAGGAVLTAPDPNVGLEAGVGVTRYLTGALGVNAEAVFDLFYGAGTYEVRYSVVPVFSLQLGLMLDLEVLP